MTKTRFAIALIFLVVIIGAGFFYSKKTPEKRAAASPTPSSLPNVLTNLSQEELQSYFDVYKSSHVLFLRKALNAYLAHDSSKACILNVAVTARTDFGIVSGLDSFTRDYYKSKFVVLTIDNNKTLENSKDIQILFQDKPDRIFYAWTGIDQENPKSNELCLMGFNSKEITDKETLDTSIEFYKPLLFDKEHSI